MNKWDAQRKHTDLRVLDWDEPCYGTKMVHFKCLTFSSRMLFSPNENVTWNIWNMITAAVIEAGAGAPNLVLSRGSLSCMQGHTHTHTRTHTHTHTHTHTPTPTHPVEQRLYRRFWKPRTRAGGIQSIWKGNRAQILPENLFVLDVTSDFGKGVTQPELYFRDHNLTRICINLLDEVMSGVWEASWHCPQLKVERQGPKFLRSYYFLIKFFFWKYSFRFWNISFSTT